jgi:hypothetical protein
MLIAVFHLQDIEAVFSRERLFFWVRKTVGLWCNAVAVGSRQGGLWVAPSAEVRGAY